MNEEAVLPLLLETQGPRWRPRLKPALIFGDGVYGTVAMNLFADSIGIGCFLA